MLLDNSLGQATPSHADGGRSPWKGGDQGLAAGTGLGMCVSRGSPFWGGGGQITRTPQSIIFMVQLYLEG